MLEVLVAIYVIYAVWAIWLTVYILERNKQRDALIASEFAEIKTLIARSQPREDYHKIVWGINRYSPHHEEILQALVPYLYPLGRTLTFSFDDMVIGNLTNKSAVVFGCDGQEEYFCNWFSKWGGGTQVRFVRYDELGDFIEEVKQEIAKRNEPI
jgi:hypothetical protein